MIGHLSDDASFWNTHRIGRSWGPWFYEHAATHFEVWIRVRFWFAFGFGFGFCFGLKFFHLELCAYS
jgi:hypothetical protein